MSLTRIPNDSLQPNYGPMGYGSGDVSPEPADASPFMSIDVYGAILRRKFIVILLALIGAGIGYLVYSRTKPVYQSSLRLMIWVQNPPSMVKSDYSLQAPPISKHQGLIASELVLSNAIKDGQLDKLATFQGAAYPLGSLRQMLTVSQVEDAADALDITCRGPIAEDLPIALEKIVDAYTAITEEDSAAAGKESIRLIEALQQRLLEDQRVTQARYQELLKKLNLSTENERGQWVNPYVESLVVLKNERDSLQKQFREADRSLLQIKNALESSNQREQLVKLVQLEARKYLELNTEKVQQIDPDIAEEMAKVSRNTQRIEAMESEVLALEVDKQRLLNAVGPRHSSVTSIDSSIKSLREQQARIREEMVALDDVIDQKVNEAQLTTTESQQTESDEIGPIRLYATALTRDRDRLKDEITQLNERIATMEQEAATIASDIVELNVLKDQIAERRDSVKEIFDKLSAINVVTNNYSTTKVRVINKAGIGYQVAPVLWQYLGIGTFAASLLGIGLAILIDHSDLSYRTPIHIQQKLRTPVLCRIPSIKPGKIPKDFHGSNMLVTHCKPHSVAAEAFRVARTSLLFSASKSGGKIYLFTSPSPGDGKSTMTANLAVSLAEAGKKVILIDADFRRPRVHTYFGAPISPGVVDIFKGMPLAEATVSTFQENLSILTTGGRPKNPGELVSSNEFHNLIMELSSQYDFVLIDSPPLLPVADAAAMARFVDGVLMVLRIRRGVAISSRKAKDQLDLVQANVVGVIVNGVDRNPYYNEYGYYSGYGSGYAGNYSRYYDAQNMVYADRTANGQIDFDE